MKIRKATKKDFKSIAEIFRIESSKPPYNKKRTPKKALDLIKEDFRENDMYVSIVDNKIVGFIMVRADSGIKNKLWINELWILKKYQSQGIGRKLMNEIENIYKNKGIKIFELVADTEKGGAVGFYDKMGYKIDKSLVYLQKKIR
jgi:ribosomal protein S18 acetylase RimI-like enzyme